MSDTTPDPSTGHPSGVSGDELAEWLERDPDTGDTDEHLPPQEPQGEAMGSVRASRRPDPITGKPLYDGDSPQAGGTALGDTHRHASDKGVGEAGKRTAMGRPSSTPRPEKGLRDF